MYQLIFEPNERDKKRFSMIFEATQAVKEFPGVDRWDTIIDLVKKLKEAGSPQREKVAGKITLYDLLDEGATIYLEKAEYKELIGFVKSPIWPPYMLEDAKDLKDWLEGLKPLSASQAKDARPEQKRRALELTKSEKEPASETTGPTGD